MKADRLTVFRGPGWRQYLATLPDPRFWPIGTAAVGNRIEGALLVDMRTGRYLLVDQNNNWLELDQEEVRLGLASVPPC